MPTASLLLPLVLLACGDATPEGAPAGPGGPPGAGLGTPGAGGAGPAMAPPMEMVLESSKVLDLSHGLAAEIPYFPGGQAFEIAPMVQHEPDGYFSQRFTTGEHTGTHVDAPLHFVSDGAPVSDLPLEGLVGPAAVIDVVQAVSADPTYAVQVSDLEAWEQRHGTLGEGHIVLIRTGWAARWSDPVSYRNEVEGELRFPGVSLAASTLLTERGVRGLGIDTLSCDPGPSKDFAVHKQFHGAGGYCIENLARLEQLPEAGATVVVAPLPIVGGSGAPARVLAIVPTGGPATGVPPQGGAAGTLPAGQGVFPGPAGADSPPGPPPGGQGQPSPGGAPPPSDG